MTARLTVFGSDSLCGDSVTSSFANVDNAALFMASVTAGFDDVSSISVEPVSLAEENNTVTTGGLWGLLFIFVIPAALLIFGFVRWTRRRKL
jgi:ABC-2 type transport system permease protein